MDSNRNRFGIKIALFVAFMFKKTYVEHLTERQNI